MERSNAVNDPTGEAGVMRAQNPAPRDSGMSITESAVQVRCRAWIESHPEPPKALV